MKDGVDKWIWMKDKAEEYEWNQEKISWCDNLNILYNCHSTDAAAAVTRENLRHNTGVQTKYLIISI